MEINQIYCGDHFAIYTNTKSLFILETNIIFMSITLQLKHYLLDIKIQV